MSAEIILYWIVSNLWYSKETQQPNWWILMATIGCF